MSARDWLETAAGLIAGFAFAFTQAAAQYRARRRRRAVERTRAARIKALDPLLRAPISFIGHRLLQYEIELAGLQELADELADEPSHTGER